jgi:hypothetical protein
VPRSAAARTVRRADRADLREGRGNAADARREQPVGAAEDGVLLVKQRRHTLPRRCKHGRHRGIAAEAHCRGGRELPQQAARFERAQRQLRGAHDLAQQPRTEAAGANAVERHAREPLAEGLSAAVGEERHREAARHELARQGLGRKHVAPGAAGSEDDGCGYRRSGHVSTPP